METNPKGLIKRLPGGVYAPESVPFLKAQSDIATVSQANGTFRLAGLITAPYNLKITGNRSKLKWYMVGMPSKWTAPAVEGVWGKNGQTVRRTQSIVLTPGALIRGQVVDENNKPVAGVYVASYGPHRPHSGDSAAATVTDSQGNYSMRVPPGKIEVYIAGLWNKVAKIAGKTEVTLGDNKPQVKNHFSNMTIIQATEGKTYSLKYRFLRPGQSNVQQSNVQTESTPEVGSQATVASSSIGVP